MKKLKLILYSGILFLGLIIISPKNLIIKAAEPENPEYGYDSLSSFKDGNYKVIPTEKYFDFQETETLYSWAIYFHMQDIDSNSYIIDGLIDPDLLYFVDGYNYYILRIKDGLQVNLNTSINFTDLDDGIYSYATDSYEYAEFAYFRNSYDKVIYEIPYCSIPDGVGSNFYSLDYYLDNLLINTFQIVLIDNGQVIDISSSLTLFNLVSDYYHLFRITEKLDYQNLVAIDQNKSYAFDLPASNMLIYNVNDYLVHSLEDNLYFTVDKKYINDVILDGIKEKFNYYVYTPTILDILKAAKEGTKEAVKKVIGADDTTLNGLYVLGYNDEIFKLYTNENSYSFFTETNNFSEENIFYPFPFRSYCNTLNSNYLNYSIYNDYKVDDSILRNNYFINLPTDPKLAFFIDGIQIDISSKTLQDLLFILNAYNVNFNNIYDYNNLILTDPTKLETNLIINDFKDVPLGSGFVKFVKNDLLYDFYFHQNNKFYIIKNLKLNDRLKHNISEYLVLYTFKDNKLLLTFFNTDETFYWDLISGKYFASSTIYIENEKEISFTEYQGFIYSHVYFNFNENIDTISSISFSYSKRFINRYFWVIHDTTEWKKRQLTISSNLKKLGDFVFHKLDNKEKSLMNDRISKSDKSNYQWKVLIGMDGYHTGKSKLPEDTQNNDDFWVGGRAEVEFKNLSVIKVDYWKDGVFYSKIVQDDFPTDGKSPNHGIDLEETWKDIKNYIKKNFDSIKDILMIIIYIVIGVLALILLNIVLKIIRYIFKLLKSIFSFFKPKKKYHKKRR